MTKAILSKSDFGFVVLEDESHHPSLSQWGSTAAGIYSSHLKQEAKKKWNQNDLNPALVSNSLPPARPQPPKFIQTMPPTGDQALERPETQGRSYSNPHRVWQAKLELTLTQIHFKKKWGLVMKTEQETRIHMLLWGSLSQDRRRQEGPSGHLEALGNQVLL